MISSWYLRNLWPHWNQKTSKLLKASHQWKYFRYSMQTDNISALCLDYLRLLHINLKKLSFHAMEARHICIWCPILSTAGWLQGGVITNGSTWAKSRDWSSLLSWIWFLRKILGEENCPGRLHIDIKGVANTQYHEAWQLYLICVNTCIFFEKN